MVLRRKDGLDKLPFIYENINQDILTCQEIIWIISIPT